MDEEAARCITGALNGSPYPLTAPEIASKIPGWTKKKVNQHIHKMGRTVEKIPGTQPPKWKLIDGATIPTLPPPQAEQTQQEGATGTSTLSVCSSSSLVTTPTQASSDEDVKQEVLRYLQTRSSPVSAPDISRSISSKLKCDTADIKRVLYDLQREAVVSNPSPKGQKPLWEMKSAKPKAETLNGKPLYTKIENENGDMTFSPVTPVHLDPLSSNSQHVIENTPTTKIPPENVSTAVGDPVKEGGSGTRSAPVKLAARFDGLTVEDRDSDEVLRQKVLDFLKSHPDEEFKSRTIATGIKYPTRDKVLYILEGLKDEKIVEETNDGHFKLK